MNAAESREAMKRAIKQHLKGAQVSVVESASSVLSQTEKEPNCALENDECCLDQILERILAASLGYNVDEFSELDCLELLFYFSSRRRDARRIAEVAIKTYGSIAEVIQRPGRELQETTSMDHSMIGLLAILKPSMKYIIAPGSPNRRELPSYAALLEYLALDYRGAKEERLRIIYLDRMNKIIQEEEMTRGTVNQVPIYPREIAKQSLLNCASSVILAHNHLGDDPTPSHRDIVATKKTKIALESLDISLYDHVIISHRQCFSMREEHLI